MPIVTGHASLASSPAALPPRYNLRRFAISAALFASLCATVCWRWKGLFSFRTPLVATLSNAALFAANALRKIEQRTYFADSALTALQNESTRLRQGALAAEAAARTTRRIEASQHSSALAARGFRVDVQGRLPLPGSAIFR